MRAVCVCCALCPQLVAASAPEPSPPLATPPHLIPNMSLDIPSARSCVEQGRWPVWTCVRKRKGAARTMQAGASSGGCRRSCANWQQLRKPLTGRKPEKHGARLRFNAHGAARAALPERHQAPPVPAPEAQQLHRRPLLVRSHLLPLDGRDDVLRGELPLLHRGVRCNSWE